MHSTQIPMPAVTTVPRLTLRRPLRNVRRRYIHQPEPGNVTGRHYTFLDLVPHGLQTPQFRYADLLNRLTVEQNRRVAVVVKQVVAMLVLLDSWAIHPPPPYQQLSWFRTIPVRAFLRQVNEPDLVGAEAQCVHGGLLHMLNLRSVGLPRKSERERRLCLVLVHDLVVA